jgi:hypothetical protein
MRGTQTCTLLYKPPSPYIQFVVTPNQFVIMTTAVLDNFFSAPTGNLSNRQKQIHPKYNVQTWEHLPQGVRMKPHVWALSQPIERFVYARCMRLCIGCYTRNEHCGCFSQSTITNMPSELVLPNEYFPGAQTPT